MNRVRKALDCPGSAREDWRIVVDLANALGAGWSAFQSGLTLPSTPDPGEEALLRQSAVTLAMAQVQEESAFLREFLTMDGEPECPSRLERIEDRAGVAAGKSPCVT